MDFRKMDGFYKKKTLTINDVNVVMSSNQKNYLKKCSASQDRINIIPPSFGYKSKAKPKYPNDDIIKIISNSDGISEAIVPNQTGISGTYLDLDNLVEQTLSLWNNQECYFQNSLAAIKFANENYTVEKETERILRLYNSLIQKNS